MPIRIVQDTLNGVYWETVPPKVASDRYVDPGAIEGTLIPMDEVTRARRRCYLKRWLRRHAVNDVPNDTPTQLLLKLVRFKRGEKR